MRAMAVLGICLSLTCCNHRRGWLDTTKASLYTASESAATVWQGARIAMDKRCGDIAEECGKRGDLTCEELQGCKRLHATIGTVVASAHTAIGTAMISLGAVEAAMARCNAATTQSAEEKRACMEHVHEERLKAIQSAAAALSAIESLRARIASEGLTWKQ